MVVPARDAAATLPAQLEALARQDYGGEWELVVADGGSIDATRAVAARHLRALPDGRLIDASGTTRNGASRGRNRGAAAARGDFLAFCDADDVASPGWLSAMALGAREGDVVAGRLDVQTLNPPELRSWHDTPPWERERPIHRFLPCASSGNCGVWADVFAALGGFDENELGAEDKDFAWRAQLARHRLHVARDAVVAYRYRTGLAATARQYFEWGAANARLFRDFRGAGMLRTSVRDAIRAWAWTLYSLPTLPWSPVRRGRWVALTAQRMGHVVGSVRRRVLFL